GRIFRGADDNAAAIAILVEVATSLAKQKPAGRGVIIAAFDAEEPPWFMSDGMGSEHFARHPIVPLDRIDLAVVMDVAGDALAAAVPGVILRRADAEVIPPLSDHDAFWRRQIPFLLLTCGRSRVYHTP